MPHWRHSYARKRTTRTAHSETGHTLTIIATSITEPVHVYQTAPGEKNRTRIATVPSTELALPVAEHHNLINLRGAAGFPEDAPGPVDHRRALAQQALDDLKSGPKDHFIIEVPKTQSLTAQRVLEHLGLPRPTSQPPATA